MPIYVTGHSLGGEEAAYVQETVDTMELAYRLAGGTVFGAPGVPGLTAAIRN